MLRSPVAHQRFANRLFTGFDARVAQFGQHHRIPLSGDDGIYNRQPGHARQIADHVMDLHIHLRQRFVHVLDMLARHLYQFGAVPHHRPYRAHIALRPKCRAQQPHRMQKLQPLAFVPVRAPPRHVFHAAGVHQTSF